MKKTILCIGCLLISSIVYSWDEEGKGITVITEGVCAGSNITPEMGQKKAIENARSEAIKQAAGVSVSENVFHNMSETIKDGKSELFDGFSKLCRSTSAGKIITEKILLNTTEIVNNVPLYRVKIEAVVVKENAIADPNFRIEIIMPQDVYYDGGTSGGDKLSFTLRASTSCYFYLFNLLENDSVQLLLPNEYVRNNFYSIEDREREFEKPYKMISFTVHLSPGRTTASEALYAVGLKNNVTFGSLGLRQDEPYYADRNTALTELQSWLVRIPADQRTDAIKIYEIRKR